MNRAEAFAAKAHDGQRYGDQPYTVHLRDVVRVLHDYGFDSYMWASAGWLHDVLEDTPSTLDQLKVQFGDDVARLVYAVTDGPGENRATRKAWVYNRIADYPSAAILKLADRIANVEAGGKLELYRKERPAFEAAIHSRVPPPMWERLILALS